MSDSDHLPQDGSTPATNGDGSGVPADHGMFEPASSAPPETAPIQTVPVGAKPPRRWIRPSVALAILCLAAGVVGSVLGARSVAHSNATNERHSFQQASAGITSTVKLALQHEEDLLTSAGTYFAGNPLTNRREFAAWTRWARTLRNHPDLQSLGLLTLVHAPDLSAFAARLSKSDGQPGEAHLKIGPSPSGAFHCLAVTTLSRGPAVSPRPGRDYCERNPALLGTRDTAFSSYTPRLGRSRAGAGSSDSRISRRPGAGGPRRTQRRFRGLAARARRPQRPARTGAARRCHTSGPTASHHSHDQRPVHQWSPRIGCAAPHQRPSPRLDARELRASGACRRAGRPRGALPVDRGADRKHPSLSARSLARASSRVLGDRRGARAGPRRSLRRAHRPAQSWPNAGPSRPDAGTGRSPVGDHGRRPLHRHRLVQGAQREAGQRCR